MSRAKLASPDVDADLPDAVVPGAATSPVRLADGSEAWAPSAVHGQHDAVRAAFGQGEFQTSEKYSGLVRIGVVIGGSIALWACILGGAGALMATPIR